MTAQLEKLRIINFAIADAVCQHVAIGNRITELCSEAAAILGPPSNARMEDMAAEDDKPASRVV
jgi:hypothetical protein